MNQPLQRRKIAVFRALLLGDMLCAIPSLRALRYANPTSEITLIGLPWAKEFVARFNQYIDRFISFPGYPGLPEQQYSPQEILTFIQHMQTESFDLVMQLHGNGSIINPLLYLFHAKQVAGFYRDEDYCPDPNYFCEYNENLSEIERLLELTKFLGIPDQGTNLEFPIFEREKKAFTLLPQFQQIKNKPYICIHPGARDPKRRWNPLYFAYIADQLAKKGFYIVFTGTQEELSIIKHITSLMTFPAINLAGQTTLGQIALTLENSQVLIANCTGISHIADALNVPSVIIYLSSDPKRWAPLNTTLHRQILPRQANNPSIVLQHTLDFLFTTATVNAKSSFAQLHKQKGEQYV